VLLVGFIAVAVEIAALITIGGSPSHWLS